MRKKISVQSSLFVIHNLHAFPSSTTTILHPPSSPTTTLSTPPPPQNPVPPQTASPARNHLPPIKHRLLPTSYASHLPPAARTPVTWRERESWTVIGRRAAMQPGHAAPLPLHVRGMATVEVINTDAFVIPTSNSFGQTFRLFDAQSVRKASVENFYRTNHINQTFSFALEMREKHLKLDKRVMTIWECCELLNEFVDESDPDLDEPQIEHLLQTAEAIRRDYPDEDWLHLTGLIHDLGKVLLHPAFGEEPQWAVVGDTFPLGCAFDDKVVHSKYFKENPDYNNPLFNTKCGIYEEGCGLDKLMMSWGHDEYMYQVMKLNNTTLPPQALYVIRYHSFYALHQSGAYTHFLNEYDHRMMPWLKIFNKYDLYSKSKVRVDVEKVKPYYLSLIEKYFPKTLRW